MDQSDYARQYREARMAHHAAQAPPRMPRCGACHNGDHKDCRGNSNNWQKRGWTCNCCGPDAVKMNKMFI